MFAARGQENLVHAHLTSASNKTLNQTDKTLRPKTPSANPPKTPRKIPLNDENTAGIRFGGGRGKNTSQKASTGTVHRDAFTTPNPATRAPLGMKTTNAKAKAFQTPVGPFERPAKENPKSNQNSVFSQRPKPRHSPVRSTTIEPLKDGQDAEEEAIEYMPPKPVDLPDYPEDFPPNMEYPQFQGANLMRGWWGEYGNPVDDEGMTSFARAEMERSRKADEEIERETERMLDEMPLYGWNVPEYPGQETIRELQKKKEAEEKKRSLSQSKTRPITSRSVPPARRSPLTTAPKTSALQPKTVKRSVAAPTSSSNISAHNSMLSTASSIRPKPTPSTSVSSIRHKAATASSRTTIGYSKGRVASGAIRPVVTERKSSSQLAGPSSNSGPAKMMHLKGMMTYRGAPPLYTTEEWTQMNQAATFGVDKELMLGLRDVTLNSGDSKEDDEVYEI